MNIRLAHFMIVVGLVELSGCGSMRRDLDSMSSWDAAPLMKASTPRDQPVDLLLLLDPERAQSVEPGSYEVALERKFKEIEDEPNDSYTATRRRLVETLQRQSSVLCSEYKTDLMQKEARGNFGLGVAALFFGTAGALVPHVATARALSGTSALATGTRSELNQAYYQDRAVAVLMKAIDKRREVLWALIQTRQDLPKDKYTLRGALADLEAFHEACSLSGALGQLDDAVQKVTVESAITDEAKKLKAFRDVIQGVVPANTAAAAAPPASAASSSK